MSSLQKESNRRILVIDDELDVLDFLRMYLESQSWDVTAVPSVDDAFRELDSRAFFLIITDIAMPKMDGYEFISKLTERQIPCEVALMTGFGYNPQHTLVRIQRTSKHPVLFKPFNRKKVSETVQTAWETYHRSLDTMEA